MSLPPTLLLGRYKLLEELGIGTYATAYKALDELTGHAVTVKLAHAHLMRGERVALMKARFDAEYRAGVRVDHPNVARIYARGEADDGAPVLVMEYIEGVPLHQILIEASPLRVSFVVELLHQLGGALQAVHDAGVIHRDLSPSNILLGDSPQPPGYRFCMLDFGVARLDGSSLGTVGPVGTPRYIAPEQLEGAACFESDVFSLGALAWWCLTGEEFMTGTSNVIHLLTHYRREPLPPDPRTYNLDIDRTLARLVQGMLHSEVGARVSLDAVCAYARAARDMSTMHLDERPFDSMVGRAMVLATEGTLNEAAGTLHTPRPAVARDLRDLRVRVLGDAGLLELVGDVDVGFSEDLEALAEAEHSWDVLLTSVDPRHDRALAQWLAFCSPAGHWVTLTVLERASVQEEATYQVENLKVVNGVFELQRTLASIEASGLGSVACVDGDGASINLVAEFVSASSLEMAELLDALASERRAQTSRHLSKLEALGEEVGAVHLVRLLVSVRALLERALDAEAKALLGLAQKELERLAQAFMRSRRPSEHFTV